MRKSYTFIPANGKASTYRSCITQKPKASSYQSQEKLLVGDGPIIQYRRLREQLKNAKETTV
jgi:hypothetical protein